MDKAKIQSLKILFTASTAALDIAYILHEKESEYERQMRNAHHQILDELKSEKPNENYINCLMGICEYMAKYKAPYYTSAENSFENGGINFKKSDE